MKKFYLQISALILIMGVSYPAFAVLCDINAEALIFGNYNAYSSNPNDSLCNITYHCTGISTNYTKVVITLTRGVSNSYNRFFYDKNNSVVLIIFILTHRELWFGATQRKYRHIFCANCS